MAMLQQYLPLAVLKQYLNELAKQFGELQQYLPLAVLKPFSIGLTSRVISPSCNSTYRLRYWNYACTLIWAAERLDTELQQYLPLAVLKQLLFYRRCGCKYLVATVPTACGIETFATVSL